MVKSSSPHPPRTFIALSFLLLGPLLLGASLLASEPVRPAAQSPPVTMASEESNGVSFTVGSSALQYPDLRVAPADDLLLGTEVMNGSLHYVVRFSATIWNAGEGPLELRGDASTGEIHVNQRIYDRSGRVTERASGNFGFHRGHGHWHFEDFASYEMWPRVRYEQWRTGSDTEGNPEWLSSKTTGLGESFCVRDSRPMVAQPAPFRYATCDTDIQGISVGWADIYTRNLPDQWVDLGTNPLPDGDYVLRIVADPRNLIQESETRDDPQREGPRANEAVTFFTFSGGVITLGS